MPLERAPFPRIAWRDACLGAEQAIAAAGIDPALVLTVSLEEGFEVVGRTYRPGEGFVDVEVRYRRLRVRHIASQVEVNSAPWRLPHIVENVIPWGDL